MVSPADHVTQAARGQIRPIHNIVVGKRHRQDVGDIDAGRKYLLSAHVRVHETRCALSLLLFGQLGAPRMLGSKNILTDSGNARLDTMQRLTSPGMVDWVDLDGDKHCASGRHYHKHHCMLFAQVMRSRLKNSRFLGPKLPRSQRACRRYEKALHGASASDHAPQGDKQMVSISEKYPQTGILRASDLEVGDLVVQVSYLELDIELGHGTGNFVDLLKFTNDDRALSLNQANARTIASLCGDESDLWPGQWVTLSGIRA